MNTGIITSTANARVKDARKLQRRRHRESSRRVLVEGVRLLRDAFEAGFMPEIVFYVPESITANEPAGKLAREIAAARVELLPCSESVFATLAETVTPQGIAAVIPLPELALPAAPTLVLILDAVRDPGNAGTLLRSAEAAGVDLAIFGPESVDPFNDKTLRAGMGAHFRLPLRSCSTWAEVAAYLPADIPLYLADMHGSRVYDEVDWLAPAALIVGGEAQGAGADARSQAQLLRIPMHSGVESLNAAVAGAVILFEAARRRRVAALSTPAHASLL